MHSGGSEDQFAEDASDGYVVDVDDGAWGESFEAFNAKVRAATPPFASTSSTFVPQTTAHIGAMLDEFRDKVRGALRGEQAAGPHARAARLAALRPAEHRLQVRRQVRAGAPQGCPHLRPHRRAPASSTSDVAALPPALRYRRHPGPDNRLAVRHTLQLWRAHFPMLR